MSHFRLEELSVGSKLLVRAKNDWRNASVRSRVEEKIVLNVISPSGRTYTVRRTPISEIEFIGGVAILTAEQKEDWRENLCKQDARW